MPAFDSVLAHSRIVPCQPWRSLAPRDLVSTMREGDDMVMMSDRGIVPNVYSMTVTPCQPIPDDVLIVRLKKSGLW